jgi:hypothetical protein
MRAAIFAVTAALALLTAAAVSAAPPPGAAPDPERAAWFRSLRSPETGVSCCSVADCRNTAVRPEPDGSISAWIGQEQFGAMAPDDWRPIPPEARLERDDNPTGHAVVCFVAGRVHCFVPETGS